jgi:GMP synthase-like glutamine amidotransferase
MKPVLILQYMNIAGPAYLAGWLSGRGAAFEVRNAEADNGFPADLSCHAALAVLGGEMSANDELPALRRAEQLIREAMRDGKPVIGHCLGGQLMARALGARVVASPAPEIGWQPMQVLDDPEAEAWFGAPGPRRVCHWHFESFELPPGARLLAASEACPRQAFAIGPHLAMQFHVEVDAATVERWSRDDLNLEPRHDRRAVQTGEAMRAGVAQHLAAQQRLADRVYARWLGAAPRG